MKCTRSAPCVLPSSCHVPAVGDVGRGRCRTTIAFHDGQISKAQPCEVIGEALQNLHYRDARTAPLSSNLSLADKPDQSTPHSPSRRAQPTSHFSPPPGRRSVVSSCTSVHHLAGVQLSPRREVLTSSLPQFASGCSLTIGERFEAWPYSAYQRSYCCGLLPL